jgi:ubiquinone/menaquinone biosynthesis C-methylase UbiE
MALLGGWRRQWDDCEVACRSCGPHGHVLVTDVDTRFLKPSRGPTLDVRAHDIDSDPLPDAEFDLIHTRLVLMHVRERDTALARMASSLKVGGWLLVEEYDSCSISPDPTFSSGEVLLQTHVAMLRLFGRWRRESPVWTIAFRVTAKKGIE